MMRSILVALLMCCVGPACAGEVLDVCFNYGCNGTARIFLDDVPLGEVGAVLAVAVDAFAERDAMARAIGLMYRMAGEQAPIAADRAGNLLDDGVDGRMDCIDHATTTTRFLELFASRGWLRFHRVLPAERRAPLFVFQHFAAAIEEVAAPAAGLAPSREESEWEIPDYIAPLLALCDCEEVVGDIAVPAHLPAGPQHTPMQGNPGARFAVDSWFVDHGEPAVVLPLADWLNGEGPNVQ